MRLTQLAVAACAVSSVSAWSWPAALNDLNPLPHVDAYLARRQDSSDSSSSASRPASTGSSQPASTSARVTDSAQNSGSSSPTTTAAPGSSGSSQASHTSSGNKPQNTSTVEINPQDPPGGIQMIMPAITSGSVYYKVGQTVTWQWNYTSLAITPTAIDILATVTAADGTNPSPFTLAVNESVQATQTFTWDTGKYYSETSELPIGTYTLIVYDAGSSGGVTAIPSPGYLAAYHQWAFGVYTPRADADATGTALAYVCATCNGAGTLERMTVSALFGIAAITVSTFMWFAGGWGALSF